MNKIIMNQEEVEAFANDALAGYEVVAQFVDPSTTQEGEDYDRAYVVARNEEGKLFQLEFGVKTVTQFPHVPNGPDEYFPSNEIVEVEEVEEQITVTSYKVKE